MIDRQMPRTIMPTPTIKAGSTNFWAFSKEECSSACICSWQTTKTSISEPVCSQERMTDCQPRNGLYISGDKRDTESAHVLPSPTACSIFLNSDCICVSDTEFPAN